MRVRLTSSLVALALLAATLVGLVATATPAAAATFSNTASIALRDPNFVGNPNCSNPAVLCNATAGTYPSNIAVSGLTGTVSSVSLSLNNVSYSFSDDIDALLVGPAGQSLIVVAAVGPNGGTMEAASSSTLTISDSGTLPTDLTPWGSAPTFKPVNFGSYGLGDSVNGFNETYTSPAPAAPWGDPGQQGANATLGNTFDGTNPNGTWSLYAITTSAGDGTGAIAGGWTINLTTAASAVPTTTVLTSAPNPSFTSGANSSVTLTATVTSTTTVNAGTVDFTDGGVTISGCGAQLVTSGAATCTTSFTTEGNHSLEALYSGTTNFGASDATHAQDVNDHTTVTGSNYCNTGSIALNNPPSTVADATPYPSEVFVSGVSGDISHLTVSLNGTTYRQSQDIDVLLVGPAGQSMILVAGAGPNGGGAISNVTLTLDDNAPSTLAQSAIWGAPNSSVTSKPVNYGGLNETWGSPAPAGPYGNPGPGGGGTATLGQVYNGTNPNGTWSLYVITTGAGDGTGAIGGGWCVNVSTATVMPTTTTIMSSNNPSFTTAPGNSVTFTATVSSTSTVGEGTVDFTSNGVTISSCAAQAVSAGTATCTTTFSAEGSDSIEALYSGDATFGASNASLTQAVNDHTTVTGNNFCNTGSIALNNPNITNPEIGATPYPSNIFVTGQPGTLQHLSVTLNNTTYSESQDIDALLVGPGGQNFILVAAAGPNSGGAISNVTLTLDDSASSTLLSSAVWGAPNSTVTTKAVNYGGNNEVWGPPAPAGPYGNPGPFGGGTATLGSTFDGSSPNGTWSLYVITTSAGDGTGAIAGGWCLGVTSPSPPTLTKSFGASSIPRGGSTSLSFTVANPNASTSLSGIGFTDTMPAGLVLATGASAPTTTCGGTLGSSASGLSLSGVTLASGASCTVSGTVTGSAAGSWVNTTSAVTSNEGGTGLAASATLVVVAPPSLSKSFRASSVALNGTTGLTFTVTNPNASTQLTGVGFTDTLPVGLLVATPNGESGACDGGAITAGAGAGSLSLSGATLVAGANCTFSVNVTGIAVGSQANTTSTISSNEGGSGSAATATLMVTPIAPQISTSFGAASIALNGSTTLSFTIGNPVNNGASTGIGFVDTLPSGLVVSTPNGVTGTCGGGTITATASSGTVSLSGAPLAEGASCTFSVSVTGTTAGVKNNSVTVSSTNGGTGNTAMASVTVVAPPTLSKSFGASMVALNGTTSLAFTVANPNASTQLTGIGFTDTFPSGLVVATPNGATGSCGGATITATAGSGSVSLTGATLAAGAGCTFSVKVTGTTAGSKVNTTTPISSNEGGAGAAATATLTVAAGPPTIAKSFGAATIPVGGSTTLSFTIANPAANGTSTGIAFTDSLPAGLVVATPNGLTGSCGVGTITAAPASGTVTLSGATLAAAATCTFSVNVTGTTAGVKNNSVSVSSGNGGTGNTASASLTVVAPPTLSKSFGAASVPLGGSTTVSFTVGNPNGTVSLSGIAFTDNLPSGVVVATPNGVTGTCGGGTITATAGSGTISLSGATLAASATCTFSVNVTGTTVGSKVNTTGAPTSTNGGTGTAAAASLVVVAPPAIAKAFGASNIALDGTTSLSFTITNPAANTVALTGVAFTDTLPAGLVVATPNGLTGTCGAGAITATAGSGSVTLTGATVVVNSSCMFSVNVTGTASGTKTNTVTVTSTNGGTGNTASATVTVALPPSIAKSFAAATVAVGGSTTLGFTITNPNSNFSLTGVAFTDTLPAGLVVSTPNGLTGSCGGGTITAVAGSSTVSLTGATLGNGGTCTFSAKVTGSTTGVKNNSVTVTSTDAGPGNTATASITVVAPPTIAKAFGAASIPFGGSTALSFTVGNPNSTVSLSGVAFTDALPAGLVVATPNGLSGSCGGGTITAGAGAASIGLSGATIAANGSCSFAVNVTATSVGTKNNVTSAVTSSNGGTGLTASATVMVTKAPTTTTVVASPPSPSFGSPVTFTATVAPSGPNGSGTNPTGTVSFYLNGSATPVATVALSAAGTASFTTAGLGAGTNTVSAGYSGDSNFAPSSSSTTATVSVTCTTTVTGSHAGLTLGPGTTCVIGATIIGAIMVPQGASLDLEGSTVSGSIVDNNGTGDLRMCGSTTSSVTVTGSTGFVVVGDAADGCAPNVIKGSLVLMNNTDGVQAIGNSVSGAVVASGNSGAGPFPDDTAPNISDN